MGVKIFKGSNFIKLAVIIGFVLCGIYIYKLQYQPTHTKDGRLIIHFWQSWSRFEEAALQKVVDDFNKSQDKLYIAMLKVSDPNKKLMLATAAGNPPDISVIWGSSMTNFAAKNALLPLNKLCEAAGFKENYYMPAVWDSMTNYGFIWALPITAYDWSLYWNKQLFREAGLDPDTPPKTIAELDRLSDVLTIVKIKRKGVKKEVRFSDLTPAEKKKKNFDIVQMGFAPDIPGDWKLQYARYFGGKYWNGKDKMLVDSPGNIAAVKWYAGYAERYGADNILKFKSAYGGSGTPQDPFICGKMAMVYYGSWLFNYIHSFNPGLDWDTAAFPCDKYVSGREVTTVGDDLIVIPRGSKHPKEAFEFMKFLNSRKQLENICLAHRKFTPLRKASKAFYEKHSNPAIKTLQKLANNKAAVSASKLPVLQQFEGDFGLAFERAFLGLATPEESLRIIQDRVQRNLDGFNSIWNAVKDKRIENWRIENDKL